MKTLLEAIQINNATTNNGALTHSTSLNANLDFFFLAGASRNINEEDIIRIFFKAYNEDVLLAYKILLWARDCRGGAGEKRIFQIICKFLEFNKVLPCKISNSIDKYGYWKDYFEICNHNDHSHIQYLADFFVQKELFGHNDPLHDVNLLAKWYPRSGPWFVKMHKELNMTPKEFRKILVKLTNVVETKMCNKEFDKINYSHVPSIAMNKYRNAFIKNDGTRFNDFIQDALKDPTKINASVIFPHNLYDKLISNVDKSVIDAVQAQWQALPNYMENCKERILPVCDVSGSMIGLPMSVSVSLGLYISERNEGIFKDAFLTFSETPELCYTHGKNLYYNMKSIESANWGMNTNLFATFDLILDSAIRENIPVYEMPTKLLIISDMEFDEACNAKYTNFESIKMKYEKSGYKMPEIIFWNVNGRIGNVPVNKFDTNVGLVSGFSPAILKSILLGEVETPTQLMLRTVDTERYDIYLEEELHNMDIIDDEHYVWSLPRYSESK